MNDKEEKNGENMTIKLINDDKYIIFHESCDEPSEANKGTKKKTKNGL